VPRQSGAAGPPRRIAIYHPHSDGDYVANGAESVAIALARALVPLGAVDLVHHKSRLDEETVSRLYGVDLAGVRLRYLPLTPGEVSHARPWARYRSERRRLHGVTGEYDLLVASAHDLPPFCDARRGALYLHFPRSERDTSWPWIPDGNDLRRRLRRAYALWEWRQRFRGYQKVLVNSAFTQEYTRRWWGLESEVVYAPCRVAFSPRPRRPLIVSVGRFSIIGTSKNQLEMVQAFGTMEQTGPDRFEYHSVGGLTDQAGDQAYFARVSAAASQSGAVLRPNLDRAALDGLLSEAKIFWHAAGYGPVEDPDRLEHFGMVTVEAMAAGCVPVVIAKGGQTEIVEHGVTGFLWQTLEELQEYTQRLMNDPELWQRMSEAAQRQAAHFSPEAFAERVRTALGPLLS
jgi:L-malate glycosyltransferase